VQVKSISTSGAGSFSPFSGIKAIVIGKSNVQAEYQIVCGACLISALKSFPTGMAEIQDLPVCAQRPAAANIDTIIKRILLFIVYFNIVFPIINILRTHARACAPTINGAKLHLFYDNTKKKCKKSAKYGHFAK
jgi:hypothetical protein